MNAALILLPLSVFTIISKTTPFWTAILGYFIMSEAITMIDIGGMIVCFGAFIYITLSTNEDRQVGVTTSESVSPA